MKTKAYNTKEVKKLMETLNDNGVDQAIVTLVAIVGGVLPRTGFEALVEKLRELANPEGDTRSESGAASVRPHPNAIQDPGVRGGVRQKPTELDAPVERRKPRKKGNGNR